MSLHQITFKSEILRKPVQAAVILPDSQFSKLKSRTRLKTLWLLHGLADNNQDFIQQTAIIRYANQYQLAIVLPDMDRSFYTNMACGPRYWSYLTDELRVKMQFEYPIAISKVNNYVAGTSMGGYGALKWFLLQPNQFQGVGILSPVLDTQRFFRENPRVMPEYQSVFNKQNELNFEILLNDSNISRYQKIYHSIANQDFLLAQNKSLIATFEANVKQYRFVTYDGNHDWPSWDKQLKMMLDWLI